MLEVKKGGREQLLMGHGLLLLLAVSSLQLLMGHGLLLLLAVSSLQLLMGHGLLLLLAVSSLQLLMGEAIPDFVCLIFDRLKFFFH
jgi:hypothetical protein